MKKLIPFTLVCLLLVGCATDIVRMTVTEPAPVTIPGDIKIIGTIDRTKPEDENSRLNRVDEVLSGEGKGLDQAGATRAIEGTTDELSRNQRFIEIKKLDTVDVRSTGLGVFPPQMEWGLVEQLCEENKCDALFVLELFDTQTSITYANNGTIKGPLGVELPAVEATMTTTIHMGWRIYDPYTKSILDEISMSESLSARASGTNPVGAAAKLMNRKEAVKRASYKAGERYAQRILPFRVRVSREYYVKGSNNLQIAKRKAQTGNWDGAAEMWLKDTEHPKAKIAGRAYYNMAISAEINGNLDAAIGWAQQAYENYGDRLALRYVRILQDRKARNERLKQQLEDQ